MTYEKLTPARFASQLKAHAYKGATGARRAVGRSSWPVPDLTRAYKLIDRYYPDAPPRQVAAEKARPPKKRAAKRKPRKPRVAVAPPFFGHSPRGGGPLLTCDKCATVYRVNAPCTPRILRAVLGAFEEDHATCKYGSKGNTPPSIRFTVEERGGDE